MISHRIAAWSSGSHCSVDALDAESARVLAQPRQRPLIEEAGEIIRTVGQQFAAPDPDEEIEEFALDARRRRCGSRPRRAPHAQRRAASRRRAASPSRSSSACVRRAREQRRQQRIFLRARRIDVVDRRRRRCRRTDRAAAPRGRCRSPPRPRQPGRRECASSWTPRVVKYRIFGRARRRRRRHGSLHPGLRSRIGRLVVGCSNYKVNLRFREKGVNSQRLWTLVLLGQRPTVAPADSVGSSSCLWLLLHRSDICFALRRSDRD